jgi:hypothetical protein
MKPYSFAIAAPVVSTLHFDRANTRLLYANSLGQICEMRLLGQSHKVLGSGWPGGICTVFPATDPSLLVIVQNDGTIVTVPSENANATGELQLASVGQPVRTADATPSGDVLILLQTGELKSFEVATGQVEPFMSGLTGIVDFTVDQTTKTIILTTADGNGRSLIYVFDLEDQSNALAKVTVDETLIRICPPAGDSALCLAINALAQVCEIDVNGNVKHLTNHTPAASVIAHWHSLVFRATPDSIDAFETGDIDSKLPVSVSLNPLCRGGWAPFFVDYSTLGLTPDEVTWEVDGGPVNGLVSVARPTQENMSAYEHRVIAGVGDHEITVRGLDTATRNRVLAFRVRVVDLWPDDEQGPPIALNGPSSRPLPFWGGGPNGVQNVPAKPTIENWRVAVVFIKTKNSTGTSGTGRMNDYMRYLAEANRFFEEVSFKNTPGGATPTGTSISLTRNKIFGPVEVDAHWDQLFKPRDSNNPQTGWNAKSDETWRTLSNAFSGWLYDRRTTTERGVFITRECDSVIFAIIPNSDQPIGSTAPKWADGAATSTDLYAKDDTSFSFVQNVPAIIMPADIPTSIASRWADAEYISTICHELGHNILAMGDLYKSDDHPAEISDRYTGNWDLMAWSGRLNHFTLPLRLRAGWVDPNWVEQVDFSRNAAPSRTIILQAIETMQRSGPSAGAKAGVEVRLRDGKNYYYEYRRAQPTQMGEAAWLPPHDAVVGTDVDEPKPEELVRPLVLLLPKDIDGDGFALKTGDDYKESDVTDPMRTYDFTVTRVPSAVPSPNFAAIRIDYIGAAHAELEIKPAPGGTNFKSPDINLKSPAGDNKVTKGMVNKIAVRVKNRGTVEAKNVLIRVSWLPYTTAAGPWTPLPNPPTQNIAARGSAEFLLDWMLEKRPQLNGIDVEHFCVRADIVRYTDMTNPSHNEINVFDNWAQSNFSTAAVGRASPSVRAETALDATNVWPRPATLSWVMNQTSPHFRAYLDFAWKVIPNNGRTTNRLSYESLAGDPIGGAEFDKETHTREGQRLINDLAVVTRVRSARMTSPAQRFGVSLQINAGLSTVIKITRTNAEAVFGIVVTEGTGQPVNTGIVRMVAWSKAKRKRQFWSDGQIRSGGLFQCSMPAELVHSAPPRQIFFRCFYQGSGAFVDCKSDEIKISV